MANKILSEYGPEKMPDSRAYCGGVRMEDVKPLRYSPPVGPTQQMRAKPGLGGTNHGNCGTQGKR